jgi:hypothetical protein
MKKSCGKGKGKMYKAEGGVASRRTQPAGPTSRPVNAPGRAAARRQRVVPSVETQNHPLFKPPGYR